MEVTVVLYKYFDRPLHIGSLDPTCVQNVRPVPLIIFEILLFKLKNKNNNNKNWRSRHFAISNMFVVQFSPMLGRHTY